ncbi:ABC transporter ATP-binding protein [Clostridium estertheticum]|uniref:ABC transporter ATP-binding protein n=1 Tax=Clostridium estertheticum TaxID=238834 RepID=UPI001C6EA6A2|nr:ABC transporter ATP-binding protein [Clostridium estertheticum]MBW9153744.1 ABC transporter ATP-binding protein [Clostridium estertheticum]WLC85878.1 ABC transporter ATP-binding protein [Clostridium estertheticum]
MSTYQNNNIKLSVENIEKKFGPMNIIKNVSFYANENEFVSLLGPSGSGKSTIFNIISGLLLQDAGKIIIDGEECKSRLKKVSYMHQKDLLLPWKNIIDNVSLPLILKGKSKKDARTQVIEYFKVFGLVGFEYKYPFQLSGGMRQRAALLRTYMASSDIMLLDEPFGALDAITRSKMHSWLLEVIKELKSTIIFITHDIEEAVFLSDRIYVLSDKPATIKTEIIVDLPKIRTKDIVTTEKFNEIKRKILQAL